MGDIDKFVRVILSTKETQANKITDLEEVIETLKNTVGDMNETIEQMNKQNDVLREDLESKVQESNDKTVMDNEELEVMEQEIVGLRVDLETSEKNYTSALDKLKQSEEAFEDKIGQVKKLKGEIIEMAEQKTQFDIAKDKLKTGYNILMNKYINLKKTSKMEIDRLTTAKTDSGKIFKNLKKPFLTKQMMQKLEISQKLLENSLRN